MADLEDVTLDGRPLQSLRVADLKAALEERGLSKSGQKNALIKRLKGALMLENLQRTSTPHIGLQPNSHIGEEMSQNSFIKQYLAKQQELLRQRLEREAREAHETNEQEDHSEVNNSTSCPPQSQDVTAALPEQHKPPGPSSAEGEGNKHQEADIPGPPASGSVAMRVPGGEHRPERGSASMDVAADSDDDDGDDDDWDSGARRSLREPARVPMSRDRSGACQPQQQHIPSLLSPQLRQPTPPPSPPPELSFPLPDTPKQSPPSPDVAAARHSPSTSSSGSSSSGSRSSSPEPQRSGDGGRKPGPLTLLARKMESEGAFSGASWHGGDGDGDRQDSSSPSTTLGLISAITHTANTSGHVSFPMIPGTTHGVTGAHSAHIQVSMSVLKATASEERDSEIEREKALELERLEKQRKLERERALEAERARALALEREEEQKALEKERIEQQQALEREEREKALQRERELALERERQERALALAKEREEREQALARERALEQEKQRELERQRALEQERLEREKEEREKREREEMERAIELEKVKALEKEREERERALELERLELERALEAERIQKEKALEQERLERERLEKEKERIENENALEQERLEREKALEQERIEIEKALEQERKYREEALEQERLERERALEQERLELEKKEKERLEREKALEHERIDRQKGLERESEEKEKAEREAALEQERKEKERAEKERKESVEKERLQEEKERALEHERLKKEKAMLKEKEEQEMVLKQEKERTTMAEKEREIQLPPSRRGCEIGLIPLPTGIVRKSLTEAEEQEGVCAPMAQNEAQTAELGAPMSPKALSSQSSYKKLRFLRDTPIQQHSSSTSMIIKRPRSFSDNPQPQASPLSSPSSVGHHQGHRPSSEREDSETQTKQEVAGPTASVETQLEEEGIVSTTLSQTSKTEDGVTLKEKELSDSVKTDQDVKEFTIEAKEIDESKSPSSPMEAAQRRGRDAKKEEKQMRQRSSSNDSSSSESDSGSSSSRSSGSSTSSQEKAMSTSRGRREGKPERDASPQHMVTAEAQPVETSKADRDTHMEEPFIKVPARQERQRKRKASHEDEEEDKQRQVKEHAMAEPEKIPETSEEIPKAFSTRKISLSSSKSSPGTGCAEGEQESGVVAGRKRRWGSSTAVTAKKPSISITTDSLKSLIPDIRPCLGQEAVVDLHPEEAVLSGAEEEEREHFDQDLQIRRTVTQVVHSESQENGQKASKRGKHEELQEEDLQEDEETTKTHEAKMDTSISEAMETHSPSHTSHDVENHTVTPSDTLIRRSISQQKMGVSITIDDPVRTARQPSPPRGKVSNIVHICNLVRPFTLGQLKELLSRTGTLVEEGFWIDKIKSHCYVTYSNSEEAVATRAALHGVKWPQSNPKVLSVEFCQQDELDFHKGLGVADRPGAEEQGPGAARGRTSGIPSLLPERDQWAEREREMERRERARAEREWDRDKVREFGKPGEEKEGGPRRSRSRERRRKERGKSKEKKTEKKEKTAEDPPAKLLDDLFRKTKAAPCIYWLPLTEEQFVQREAARAERMKEREKRRKEQEEEEKKKEEERKERIKAVGSTTGDRSEGEKEKDRERERDRDRDRGRDRERDRERVRENDKRRDGYRRPGGSGAGGGRRSRSRSDPRERRR